MSIQVIGNTTGTVLEVDANTSAVHIREGTKDYADGGSYSKANASGTIAAGLAANANVYHFRTTSPDVVCVIRRVRISAQNAGTAFAAGVCTFRIFVARDMTANVTVGNSGTVSSRNAKLKTGFGASKLAVNRYQTANTTAGGVVTIINTGALTTVGAVLDTDPIAAITTGVEATAFATILSDQTLFEAPAGEYGLACAEWEGFTIQATVPATGTWVLRVTTEWDEVPYYP